MVAGVDQLSGVSVLIRVSRVRVQNKFGAIFFGQRVNDDGEICDIDEDLTVNLQQDAVGIRLCEGQRWRVQGEVRRRTVVTPTGFRRVERTIAVTRGKALLVKPSGIHIRDYFCRHPDLVGIREATATKLWDRFGEQLYAVLDEADYQALVDVVTPAKAAKLIEVWHQDGLSQTIQFLASHDVSPKVGRRVVEVHGADAMNRIKDDPYRLLSYSARWQDVDALAASIGVSADDPRRLAAACDEVVYRQFSKGHTYVPREVLVARLKPLLNDPNRPQSAATKATVEGALVLAEEKGRLLFDRAGNGYSVGATVLEQQVAQAIAELMAMSADEADVASIIRTYEKREGNGFKLNEKQREAVELVASYRFAVVTGGAGCGKTTALKAICDVLEFQGYQVVQVALTGKAVKRMAESSGRKAKTIAGFLQDRNRVGDDRERSKEGPTAKQALLIDEASMVDLISFAAIARTLDDCSKLVMVGDPHQLPPVGPGLILHALVECSVPHVQLEASERFGSDIADVANSVRDGSLPDLTGNPAVSLIEPADLGVYAEWAKGLYLEDHSDAVVLCHGRDLAQEINALVQDRLTANNRPMTIWNHQYDARQDLGFREGDFVICTKNFWEKGLQNGSIGQIKHIGEIDQDDVSGEIAWDDGEVRSFDQDLIGHLELAYALTIHKAQGSQWRRVVVCLKGSAVLDRSLIYTALTRATNQVIIVGSRRDLEAAIKAPKAADRRRVALGRWMAAIRAESPLQSRSTTRAASAE